MLVGIDNQNCSKPVKNVLISLNQTIQLVSDVGIATVFDATVYGFSYPGIGA